MPDLVTMAEAALARIAQVDPHLRAFATVEPEWVREQVWHQQKRGAKGRLAGLTLGVKDLLDVQGLPTGGGARTPVIADANRNADVVARLVDAGMLVLGKTHTVELAFGTWGINRATATPRNPWDAEIVRVPGGSSSGSAVSVAAGLVDAALGTDTGGSIRIPSALNNLAGLKPTHGRISLHGCLPLCPDFDTIGPMGRTVERLAFMLDALIDRSVMPANPSPKLAAQAQFDATSALTVPLRGLTLAVLPDLYLDGVELAVGTAYLAALACLEKQGAKLVEAAPIIHPLACVEPSGLMMAGHAWRLWRDRHDHFESEMDKGVATRLRSGNDVSDTELSKLAKARVRDQARFHAWAQDFDALLTPTVPLAAPALADADEGTLPFSRYVRMANWLNLPALAVPCGMDVRGLSLSLQILSTPWRESILISIGAAYQKATDWADRRPDIDAIIAAATKAKAPA